MFANTLMMKDADLEWRSEGGRAYFCICSPALPSRGRTAEHGEDSELLLGDFTTGG